MPMRNGFTLAELLIALTILGVIATFTIPKVLQSQQDGKYKAIAKEGAAAISNAFYEYKLRNTLTDSTTIGVLMPYLNYINVYTGTVDRWYGDNNSNDCNTPAYTCVQLANGSVLLFNNTETLSGTATTNALYFHVDPDGKITGDGPTGNGKSVVFFLYTTGRITTWGTTDPATVSAGTNYGPDPTKDPPWFSWN